MYLCSQIEFIQGLLFWQEEKKKEQINKHNDTPSNKEVDRRGGRNEESCAMQILAWFK